AYDDEKKKKNKKKGAGSTYWRDEFITSGMTKQEVECKADEADAYCKTLEAKLKPMRERLTQLDQQQAEAKREHRRLELKVAKEGAASHAACTAGQKLFATPELKQTYGVLKQARSSVAIAREAAAPLEMELQNARQSLYDWNKLFNAAKAGAGPASTSEVTLSKATWENPACEDAAEKLDIQDLVTSSRGGKGVLAFGGTDYGIRTMSESCGLSLEAIEEHINIYHAL
ncbi:hypothetical protein BGZ72_003103, partial [Mortierella alpina]